MAAGKEAPKILIITEGGPHIWALVNAIAKQLGSVNVIVEEPESKRKLLLGRARRQGWISAGGQFATMIAVRLAKRWRTDHMERLISSQKLETSPKTDQTVIRVPSANAPQCLAAIESYKPSVILLAGCRLLNRKTLAAIQCPVLNYHAGITPKYRGMNGGYWALATGDAENFGTTLHLVDAGIDTGGVLAQARGKPASGDTIASYALVQVGFSREICIKALENAMSGKLETIEVAPLSKLWFHPTIWFYLWTGLTKHVW